MNQQISMMPFGAGYPAGSYPAYPCPAPARPPMTPEEAFASQALEGQQRVTPWPYYSQVRIRTNARAPAAPAAGTYTLPTGAAQRAFGYAVGEDMAPAGAAGFIATAAQTNLTVRGHTISGQSLYVTGIGLLPLGWRLTPANRPTDARLLDAIAGHVAVTLSVNGDENSYRLGTLEMLPAGRGLQGGRVDTAGVQPIAGGRPTYEWAQNGWPVMSNTFPVPEGIVWSPQGQADSQLNVIFTATQDVIVFTGGDPNNNLADELAAVGIRGYNYPADALEVDVQVWLRGRVCGPRSRIS